jgi:8-oxo-dGTP diphosphatase
MKDKMLNKNNKTVVKLTESKLKRIIKESVMAILEDLERLDKYGKPIPRYGQGWGEDDSLQNRQGYNADGSKGPWFSRSAAVATAVLLNDNGRWYVLANQRGSGTPDYQGYWNLPCGYLDYNEDAAGAAMREVYEETGIKLTNVKEFGHSTSPKENRQNICFFFVSVLNGSISQYNFSTDNMEEDEVSGIQWLPLDKCDTLQWAFDHDELMKKVIARYGHLINNEDISSDNNQKLINKAIRAVEQDVDKVYILNLLYKLQSNF